MPLIKRTSPKDGHFPAISVYELTFLPSDFSDNAELDLAVDLPDEGLIVRCWLEITAVEATATIKTLSYGLLSSESGGDADGFDVAVDVSALGKTLGNGALVGTFLDAVTAASLSATFGDAAGPTEMAGKFVFHIAHDSDQGDWNQLES